MQAYLLHIGIIISEGHQIFFQKGMVNKKWQHIQEGSHQNDALEEFLRTIQIKNCINIKKLILCFVYIYKHINITPIFPYTEKCLKINIFSGFIEI